MSSFTSASLIEQRLRVGVDRDELDALQARVDHPVDGVATAAADADDLDHREVVLRLAQHPCASLLVPWDPARSLCRIGLRIPGISGSGLAGLSP